ncbi:transcriptional regulator [Paenibacillus sp. TAB 01]|uniref:transcriptional regulator n=1 Tax=Paenibacillus sp. TAB 01 TaxID=3368988 RepID=UPI003751C541
MALRQSTFKNIEDELRDYHATVQHIRANRQALLHGESDGRAVTALASNRALAEMENVTQAIEYVVSLLPDERKRMLHLRYWMRPQVLTWDGIAMKCNANRSTVIRWRNEIVAAVAERLGRR